MFFFFSSRRRHTRYWRDWSSDVCSSDLPRELDQDVGDKAEPYAVGDVKGQRQRQDGQKGGYSLVEVVPGDKEHGGDHQEPRSEERRGGKECRSRGSPDHLKKKNTKETEN